MGSLIKRQSNTKERNEQIAGSVMSSKARGTVSRVYIGRKNSLENSKVNSCNLDNSQRNSDSLSTEAKYC